MATAEFNQDYLYTLRMRSLFRGLARTLIIVCALGIVLLGSADYFANLPRERFARKFSYWQRVQYGFSQSLRAVWLTMVVPADDPALSKLPIFELYVDGPKLDALNSKLPASGRNYQSAMFKGAKKIVPVRTRYRGDSINHWAFDNKSWRVKVTKGELFKGHQYFNLNVPRTETQIANWLGYKIGSIVQGPLTPQASFVHFRLNREYRGVRLFLEQPDQDFLRVRGLLPGKIFNGDITTEQIYGGAKRHPLYGSTAAWTVDAIVDDTSTTELDQLLRVMKATNRDPYEFHRAIREIVDVESLLKYMALLELVGSVHVDNTHNNKYYFNPIAGKFVPIVWDTVAYMWKNQKRLDYPAHELFRNMLSIPEFREEKDRYLWEFINGELSTDNLRKIILEVTDQLRPDLHRFALKIHANDRGVKFISNERWERSIDELLRVVGDRNQYIADELGTADLAHRVRSIAKQPGHYLLAVQVNSRAGVHLSELVLELDRSANGQKFELQRRGLTDIGTKPKQRFVRQSTTAEQGRVLFALDDPLFSKRRVRRPGDVQLVPGTYVFELKTAGSARISKVKSVTARSLVNGQRVKSMADPTLTIPATHRKNIVWWQPDHYTATSVRSISGQQVVKEDLIVGRHERLEITPGSQLRFAPGVSLLVRGGELVARGTAKRPIVFEGESPTSVWGVVAFQDQARGKLQHVRFEGGSGRTLGLVNYEAPLSIHDSEVNIANARFVESYVSAKNSVVSLNKVHFYGPYLRGISAYNSSVKQEQVETEQASLLHHSTYAEQDAFGSAPRLEREFKFSILDQGLDRGVLTQRSMTEIASEVNAVLAKSIATDTRWQVPAVAGNQLYTDLEPADFAFRDVYFDTADRLNLKHSVSHRLRHRFRSLARHDRHIKTPDRAGFYPHRVEFQAKVNRQERGDGFSTVEEARFEFRKESAPFSTSYLPPSAPWDLEDFVPYFKRGTFQGMLTWPGKLLMQFHKSKGEQRETYSFEPTVVVVTERLRQHLNVKSPWGSGPNPEQAYIISLDKSLLFRPKPYLDYVKQRTRGVKLKRPSVAGTLLEIEIEFERNVSRELDNAIAVASSAGNTEQLSKLTAARDAFLHDQREILRVLQEHFATKGIKVVPATASKYTQAMQLLSGQADPKSFG